MRKALNTQPDATPEPKTVKEAWDYYFSKFYPEGASPEQLEQVEIAFYCGSYTGISQLMSATDDMDSDQTLQFIRDRLQESTVRLRDIAKHKKQREAKDN